jgi:hypothetical protein
VAVLLYYPKEPAHPSSASCGVAPRFAEVRSPLRIQRPSLADQPDTRTRTRFL